jgi:A/G-specific adenine glycosylase
MTSSARVIALRTAVLRWFSRHGRTLPWRETRDPWRVLVSEFMLQQTQVERVIPKYQAFVRRWPTPSALAAAPLAEVVRAWSGLGYNRRAKHLHDASKAIAARFGGEVPRSTDELESLPGIGAYTARAVASFAFNDDVALWDTNVRRIFLRVVAGGEFAKSLPDDRALEAMLASAVPKGRSRDWHGALMDFGSAVCTGRKPLCGACPARRHCAASAGFLSGREPRVSLVKKQAAFAGSRRQGRGALIRLLASRRTGIEAARLAVLSGRADAAALIDDLEREGLVTRKGARVRLA